MANVNYVKDGTSWISQRMENGGMMSQDRMSQITCALKLGKYLSQLVIDSIFNNQMIHSIKWILFN